MMDTLIQVAAAIGLIVLMIGFRIASSQAIFRFRMNHGFRAHDCDGSCASHVREEPPANDRSNRI
jgi:hypothetical protein